MKPVAIRKAHKHGSAAVLFCVKGKGYTYTWPESLGTTPWKDGHSGRILRQDYEYGGMVSAAPMSGAWFHQHFSVAKDGLRVLTLHGPNNHRTRRAGIPGPTLRDYGAIDLKKGGTAIPYCEEDPEIRRQFADSVLKEGVDNRMEPELYDSTGTEEPTDLL